MSSLLAAILPHLREPKLQKDGRYRAWCPFHPDGQGNPPHAPDFYVWPEGGFICHGCDEKGSLQKLAEHLGLGMDDLFQDGSKSEPRRGRVVATYPYTSAEGQPFEIVRFEPKDFGVRRPDGGGGHIENLGGLTTTLYHEAKVKAAIARGETIFVAEGEKDCDALWDLGLVATTNPFGAGKWRNRYTEALRGADLVIIPDNDAPGRAHALKVAEACYGKAKGVCILELPGLPPGGDASDWLGGGGTIEGLKALAAACPDWEPGGAKESPRGGFHLTPLADLLSEPAESTPYLWSNTLPTGGTSIVAAKPKVGKTTTAHNLSLRVSRGENFLGRGTTRGRVVYLALEEKRSEVAAKFIRMGAGEEDIYIHTGSAPEEALVALDAAIHETKAVLAVVDPLQRLIRLRDGNDYTEVTKALEPLVTIARSSGCHIMLIHHLGKGGDQREGGDGILGSTALFGGVDTAIIMRRREGGRTIETIQRYGIDLPRTLLAFNPVTGLVEANGTVEEMELARAAAAICEALGEGDLTEKELRETLAGNTGLVGKALRWLHQEGYVKREGAGKRGAPYIYILVSRFSYVDKREKQENEKPLPSVLRV